MNTTRETGTLFGIGVGPGDYELLTLKAQRILSEVPVIFVPKKSETSDSMAEAILTSLDPSITSRCIGIILPMLRDQSELNRHWRQAAEIIWSYMEQGQNCAFINIGDPMLYGTFVHVTRTLLEMQPAINIEVIPGISSINAAAARAFFPLTTDNDTLAILSGSPDDTVIRNTLANFNTIVFLKVNTVFDRLIGILEHMALIDRCVYVRRGTTAEEEIVRDINCLRGKKLDYFSLLMVRK